ncbi:MAG: FG-GAP-like repeat-containing protein [Candidatus Gracilibacteria bacterium]|nr:FG-GAP-like repeat-containing protein [Candidatus Gracilibacteria bacterium]
MHIKKANLKLALIKSSLKGLLGISLFIILVTQVTAQSIGPAVDWNRPYVFSGFFESPVIHTPGDVYPVEKDRIEIGDNVYLHWNYPDESSPHAPVVEHVRVGTWYYPAATDFSDISVHPDELPSFIWRVLNGNPEFGNGDELIEGIRQGNLLLQFISCYGIEDDACDLGSGYIVYYFEAICNDGVEDYACANSYSVLHISQAEDIQINSSFGAGYLAQGEATDFSWEITGSALGEYGADSYYAEVERSFEDIYRQASAYPDSKVPGDAWVFDTISPVGFANEVSVCKYGTTGCNSQYAYTQGPGRYTYTTRLFSNLPGETLTLLASDKVSLDVTPTTNPEQLIDFSSTNENFPTILSGAEETITIDNYQSRNVLRVKKYFMPEGNTSFQEITCIGTASTCETGYGFVVSSNPVPQSFTLSQAASLAASQSSLWTYYAPGLYKFEFSVYEDTEEDAALVKQAILLFNVTMDPDQNVSTLRFNNSSGTYSDEIKKLELGEETSVKATIATSGARAARIKQYYRSSSSVDWPATAFATEAVNINAIEYGDSAEEEVFTIGPSDGSADFQYDEYGEYRYVLEVFSNTSYSQLLAQSFVRLEVINPELTSESSDNPTPLFIVSPGGGYLNLNREFYFDASASYDLYDSNLELNTETEALDLEYKWDFGDGSDVTSYSSDPTVKHTYERVGNFAVILTVRDAEGNEASKTLQGDERVKILDHNYTPQNGAATFVMVSDIDPEDYDPSSCIDRCGMINSTNPIEAFARSKEYNELNAPVEETEPIYQVETVHSDLNGYEDIHYAQLKFIVGEDASPEVEVLLSFDEDTERFMVWDDTLGDWDVGDRLSDIVPAGDIMVSNDYIELLDTSTVTTNSSFGINVTWDLVFRYDNFNAALWKNTVPKVKIATVDAWGAYAPATCQQMFYDVAELAGINEIETTGANLDFSTGASWVDIDDDGDLDLYITNGNDYGTEVPAELLGRYEFRDSLSTSRPSYDTGKNLLYINNGDGTFSDETESFDVAGSPYGITYQATFADIDNDGDQDLYIANMLPLAVEKYLDLDEDEVEEGRANILYINNGDGTFTDKTAEYFNPSPEILNSSSAAFADYDNDGDLDLIVTNTTEYYNDEGEGTQYTLPGPNMLYTNNYPSASFSKAASLTGYAGIADGGDGPATWVDYDLDGDVDLFIANKCNDLNDNDICEESEARYNTFFENTGNGFVEKAGTLGILNTNGGNFAANWGDFNNDGYLDLFITSSDLGINRLYQNNGAGTFTDVTSQKGLPTSDITAYGQNSTFVDYDNDGDLDILVSNIDTDHANYLYENQGAAANYVFAEASMSKGLIDSPSSNSQAHAWADYDNDGDLDLFIANSLDGHGANRLYQNNQAGCTDQNYLKLKLVGARDRSASGSNLDSLGAFVTLETSSGTQLREVLGMSPYAQDSSEVEFGLGTNEAVRNLEITWPSGITKSISNLSTINQTLTYNEIDELLFSAISFGRYDAQAVAVGDLDNDGLPDIVLGNRGKDGAQNFLYQNMGNNEFKEYPAFGEKSMTGAINLADLDNDGDLDVLVGNNGQNYLYRNEGKFKFTEIPLGTSMGDTFGLIPFDLNGDEVLDIIEVNFDGSGNHIYLGEKDALDRYKPLENALGTYKTSSACVADFDADGDSDVALATYGGGNMLFINSDGNLKESSLLQMPKGNYTSCAWGDYDNDGYPDLAFAGLEGSSVQVLRNNNGTSFTSVYNKENKNVDIMGLSWADFNNDGYLDLLTNAVSGDPSYIYLGDGEKFVPSTFYETSSDITAIALADFDSDGDMDIVAGTSDDNPNLILLNQVNSRNFLKVKLIGLRGEEEGTLSNSYALGAKIIATPSQLGIGGDTWLRSLDANSGRSNMLSSPIHFGLNASDAYDVSVTFPSGTIIDQTDNAKLGSLTPSEVGISGYITIDEKGNVSGI